MVKTIDKHKEEQMKMLKFLRKNPCKECRYYQPTNNTCQYKKCALNNPYVIIPDRLFCELRTDKHINKESEKE